MNSRWIVYREYLNRHTPYAMNPKMIARTKRSTAKKRRIRTLRSSSSRRTRGAAAAGPDAAGGPGTKVAQRRHCHASPEGVVVRSLARTSGSAGA